ncbi:MAG: DUF1638 domain-containing protein [Spirochaetales bacterium]|nr:DUF1638 domain-containing protein [Spirochaetales bacterium]
MEIISCGILKKEIQFLVRKNNWPVRERYISSSLHVDFDVLEKALNKTLGKIEAPPALLVYGNCHPLMDEICTGHGAVRTEGQNCVELLLGAQRFNKELEKGAFFLMEDWVLRWDEVMLSALGHNKSIWRELFRDSHKYFLALRTPCSGDFKAQAEKISRDMELPLHWMQTDLANLERVLRETADSAGKPDI